MPDLDAGLAFYRDKLGCELVWHDADAAGLRMPDSEAGRLLVTARPELELDLIVESAAQAARRWQMPAAS